MGTFHQLCKKSNMRIFNILFITCLVASCNSKESETTNLEEIMPTSKYDQEQREDTVSQVVNFKPSIDETLLKESKIVWDSIKINEDLTVVERFNPKATEKFTYWSSGNEYNYYRWSFKDSTKSMRAFLNWMNCYGEKCSMVELKKSANIQRNAFITLQLDTAIIQIESPFNNVTELKKWKKLYTTDEQVKLNFILLQPKGGKVAWSQFVNKQEVTIELKEQ